jgi:hypothetical protein
MMQRCFNPKHPQYADYGGRGITVCVEWRTYADFAKDMGHSSGGLTLDRIDNNKGYCKANCRWATRVQQMRNVRRNSLLTFQGQTCCISEWSERLGINAMTINTRLRRGWGTERALSTPARPYPKITKTKTENSATTEN